MRRFMKVLGLALAAALGFFIARTALFFRDLNAEIERFHEFPVIRRRDP